MNHGDYFIASDSESIHAGLPAIAVVGEHISFLLVMASDGPTWVTLWPEPPKLASIDFVIENAAAFKKLEDALAAELVPLELKI